MALFDEQVTNQLKEILNNLQDEVNIILFQQTTDCKTCGETKMFLEEFAALSGKLKLEILDFIADKEEAIKYNITKVPAIVITDKNKTDRDVRFYGMPNGYEINSFLAAVFEASGVAEPLPEDLLKKAKEIDKDIHIQVFVTPSCPHCSGAVVTAHRLAFANSRIKADMVECTAFPELADKYNVSGVPKIVINEKYELVGNQPMPAFLEIINQI